MKVSPETDIRAEWYEAEGTAHPAVLSASMKIVRTISRFTRTKREQLRSCCRR